jgi:fermentation-respiration switch protein FrsA (DUF1100 family)
MHDIRDLQGLDTSENFDELITVLRERVAQDVRVLAEGWVKGWVALRWRSLFLDAAAADDRAVRAASRRVGPGALALRVVDRRPVRQRLAARFLAEGAADWDRELPPAPTGPWASQSVLYCPSFMHSAIPLIGFGDEFPVVADALNLDVVRVGAHAVRSAHDNVVDIAHAMQTGEGTDAAGLPIATPVTVDRPVIMGYSKGATDALAFLVEQPELAAEVRSFVSWAGALGGSPAVDGLYRQVVRLPEQALRSAGTTVRGALGPLLPLLNLQGLLERPAEFDLVGALRDLTTGERAQFLAQHRAALDALDLPIFTLAGSVRATEIPYFQMQGAREVGRVAGPNDMQVAVRDATIDLPLAINLGVVRAHHWDIALGPFPRSHRLGSGQVENPFPTGAALTATFLVQRELGLLA